MNAVWVAPYPDLTKQQKGRLFAASTFCSKLGVTRSFLAFCDEERKVFAINLREHLQFDKIYSPFSKLAFGYERMRFSHASVDLSLSHPCVVSSADQSLAEGFVGSLVRLILGIHVLHV
jgi:hypothetical protein